MWEQPHCKRIKGFKWYHCCFLFPEEKKVFELGALESGYVCSGHPATLALGSSRFPAESPSCFPELLPHEAAWLPKPCGPRATHLPAPRRAGSLPARHRGSASALSHPCSSPRFCVRTEGLSPHLREASREPAENPTSWSSRASSGRSVLSTRSMSS